MIRRLLTRRTGDHHDTLASAWWHGLERNRTRRLTDQQVDEILGRWQ